MAEFSTLIPVVAILLALIAFLYFIPLNLWITARFSGVKVALSKLIFMRIRRVSPGLIVRSMILATKAGIKDITTDQLEAHFLAGGNVPSVIKALIVADKANLDLHFKQATAIDLAGRDVLQAVQVSVTPYVIIVPAITGVSVDGIQLVAEARVTVRANLQRLVGGAGEDTIMARVGQGIISTIGMEGGYQVVLENPHKISQRVLENGLDAGTAFEILSIDISDMDIGKNIGALLRIDQANADLRIAKAKAEERRSMGVALEQEMVAKIQEARAMVIEAEAEIPFAMSAAFRSGRFFGKRQTQK